MPGRTLAGQEGTQSPEPINGASNTVKGQLENSTTTTGRAPNHRSEHRRSLQTPKGRHWLAFTVGSRAPNPSGLPIFFEGDDITGKVELDLEKAESIKGVTVSVVASTTFVGQDEEVFLREEQTIWTPPAQGGSKVNGKHSWPFSIKLPSTVMVKERDNKQGSYGIPPTFMERASPAYIDYKLVITVKRGFLRVNQTLMTNIVYIPMTLPDSPSHLRRMAYMEQSPLLGPDGDPEGWRVFPPVKVTGTLFNAKKVTVECTVAIGAPLSYAVGTPIPLHVVFRSKDTQALDVLAQPSAIKLRLQRSMATGVDAVDDNGIRRTDNHFLDNQGLAYFWPERNDTALATERVFQGELEVGKDLKPSFKFPRFTIRYNVQLLPFSATGFVPDPDSSGGGEGVLLSEQIVIASRQLPGVVAHSYAPPGYEKPQTADYNNSVGLLEIGNQRFVHYAHHGA